MQSQTSLRVLSEADVQALVRTLSAEMLVSMMAKTMYAINADQVRLSSSSETVPRIQNPDRISTESELHTTLYMPSRLTTSKDVSMTAVKVVAVPKPSTSVPGLPATTLLFDETNGRVRAVVNASQLTGLRTAAASALATRLLADPTAKDLLVFGSGSQAYYHARLILELMPSISHLTIIVRKSTRRAELLVAQIQGEFPKVNVVLERTERSKELVASADIICCCVPSTSPVFDSADLKPGVHVNAIGSYKPTMQEFPPELISKRSHPSQATPTIPIILVDSRAACLKEAGELIAAQIDPANLIELGEVVQIEGEPHSQLHNFGLRKNGRSLFKCVGIGGMDVAITTLVVEMAESLSIGTVVPF